MYAREANATKWNVPQNLPAGMQKGTAEASPISHDAHVIMMLNVMSGTYEDAAAPGVASVAWSHMGAGPAQACFVPSETKPDAVELFNHLMTSPAVCIAGAHNSEWCPSKPYSLYCCCTQPVKDIYRL